MFTRKYPEVSMVNCTDMSNTVKSMNTTIRTHGRLYEIWSDGTQFTFVTIVSLVINLFLFFFLYGATEDHPIMRRRGRNGSLTGVLHQRRLRYTTRQQTAWWRGLIAI